MKLFTGTAHLQLANDIAACLDAPLADVKVTAFPDGETFVKINENIRGFHHSADVSADES